MFTAIEKADLGTVRILDHAYQQRVADALIANQQRVVLPVFLAAVLSRIDHLNQFYECAEELRQQAKPLRRRLVAIEQALDSTQPQREIRKLLTAFGDDSRLLRRTVWEVAPAAAAVTGVVLTAATGQPLWLTATVSALAAAPELQRQTWSRLANRVWRRDLWFVTELGQASSELLNATPGWRNYGGTTLPRNASGAVRQPPGTRNPVRHAGSVTSAGLNRFVWSFYGCYASVWAIAVLLVTLRRAAQPPKVFF